MEDYTDEVDFAVITKNDENSYRYVKKYEVTMSKSKFKKIKKSIENQIKNCKLKLEELNTGKLYEKEQNDLKKQKEQIEEQLKNFDEKYDVELALMQKPETKDEARKMLKDRLDNFDEECTKKLSLIAQKMIREIEIYSNELADNEKNYMLYKKANK